MGCKVVKVKPLSEQESMSLFLYHVGDSVQQNRDLKDIVKKIVEECGGLPLALATIGSSMKGEDDISEWRNTLKELEERVKSVKGSGKLIFEQLKFSYDRLKDYPNIQNCFLYCSLYPEDYAIDKRKLIESWIDEGLLDDLETRQAMHDRGHSILNKLENNCLLEKAGIENISKMVKMHDVLRDMALTIKGSDRFMVKADAQLKEVPGEYEWKMTLEKVSLMNNSILDIPPHLSPKCPHLTTLLLQRCEQLKWLSKSFFVHMPALKVLNLSFTRIIHIPTSISLLKNLSALILVGCFQLRVMPSLAELRALRKVDLSNSNIEEVPQGLEMLENLTCLRLGSWYLKELPVGIISSRISHLQCLEARGMHLRGEEVAKLRKLEILVCSFCDLQEFQKYVRLIQGEFPTIFHITVGSTTIGIVHFPIDIMVMSDFKRPRKFLAFIDCKMEKIDDMMGPVSYDVSNCHIEVCDDLKCLNKNSVLHKAKELKYCEVQFCGGMECVFDLSLSSSSCNALPLPEIEMLNLSNLSNLGELLRVSQSYPRPPAPHASTVTIFTSLRILRLIQCPSIETLFPFELLQGLHNLENITVLNCEKVERIFGEENVHDGYEGISVIFKLKSLTLSALPRLKSICSVGIMIPMDHLQFIRIADCPQLKMIPFSLPLSEKGQPFVPPSLESFYVWPREWWESVEFDDLSPSTKNVFSSFVTYSP